MSKYTGVAMLLKMDDGSGTIVTVGAQLVSGARIANQSIDVTDKDDSRWKKLMAGGVRDLAIDLQGRINDGATFARLQALALSGASVECEMYFGAVEFLAIPMQVMTFSGDGDYRADQSYALTLISADVIEAAKWDSARLGAHITLSNGNLTATNTSGSNNLTLVQATHPKFGGRYYWEVKVDTLGSLGRQIGIGFGASTSSPATYTGGTSTSWGWWGGGDAGNEAALYYNNAQTVSNSRYRYAQGDVLMFELDIGAGKAWLGKNGNWIDGDPATGLSPSWSNIPAGTYAPTMSPSTAANGGTLRADPVQQSYSAPANSQAGWY